MKAKLLSAPISGVFFLLGFMGVPALVLTQPILKSGNYLQSISQHQPEFLLGTFFLFIMAAACAAIGITLYPVLRKTHEGLAMGALVFRILESVFQFAAVLVLLGLVTLSDQFVAAGAATDSPLPSIASVMLGIGDWLNNVIYLVLWCIGALMYYWIFFKTRLLPAWLSIWGILGCTLTLTTSFMVFFGVIEPLSSLQVLLNIPIALQELVMALWLIFRGFTNDSNS